MRSNSTNGLIRILYLFIVVSSIVFVNSRDEQFTAVHPGASVYINVV